MINETPVKTYQYSGVLASICEDFIAEKRAVGNIYNTEAKHLRAFSIFTLGFDIPANVLTEEVVQAWIAKKTNDSDRSQYARFSLISLFSRYMVRMGYSAHLPSRNDIGKLHKTFIPYIFTHQEIKAFFKATDSMKLLAHSIAPRRHQIMPILFRILYCCGLRVSEATKLLSTDVDLDKGILTIRESKFRKTRYVPMSAELAEECGNYAKTRLINQTGEDWFFTAPDGGHYNVRSIYSIFRNLLWEAGISHGGRGKGPRLHDFRHTFAVHCLQKWGNQGADLTTALPRLATYLGHNDFSATEKYLRMTAEVYPEMSSLMQENYGYVIPKQEVTAI